MQDSNQQQHGAPAMSHLECAREAPARRADRGLSQCGSATVPCQPESATEAQAAPAAQGQAQQRGRAPGPSPPDFASQGAGALADLRLDSAPRKRLPTSRSLCYSEGPAVLDDKCIGSDPRFAGADKRCNGRASSPADERCDDNVSSPADEHGNGSRASSPAVERCDGRAFSPAGNGLGCNGSAAGRAEADARCGAISAGPATAPGDGCSTGAEPTQEPTQGAWRLEDAQALVVYGLGSLEGGPAPRYQLALALLLAARMPALQPPVEVRVNEGMACCSASPTQPC